MRVIGTQEVFRQIIDASGALTEWLNLEFQVEGVDITVVDPFDVNMIVVHLSPKCFEKYLVEEPTLVFIKVKNIADLLSLVQSTPSELIELSYNPKDMMVHLRAGRNVRIEESSPQTVPQEIRQVLLPSLVYSAKIVMHPSDANRALIAALRVGPLVDLTINGLFAPDPEGFSISVRLEEGRGVSSSWNSADLEIECPRRYHASSCFETGRLQPMMSVIADLHNAHKVTIEFANKFPISLSWITYEGEARWIYFLAPRVPNEKAKREATEQGKSTTPPAELVKQKVGNEDRSFVMQDSVVSGDAMVDSTKIEQQIIHDPNAIADAAIEGYRKGLKDRQDKLLGDS